jgi:uncharacterized protein (UPF0332 family)
MSFDWADFLRLAKMLLENPGSPGLEESCLRSAASRAYYAAYHCALKRAYEEGYQPLPGDEHRSLQRYFAKYKPISDTRGKIAVELGRLWDHRRQADYHSRLQSQPRSLARNAVGMADTVLECLDRLRTE